MEETTFSNADANADEDVDDHQREIDKGRPSFRQRTLNRASMRRRQSRKPSSGDYGTFNDYVNQAYERNDIDDYDVEAANRNDIHVRVRRPDYGETSALSFKRQTSMQNDRWAPLRLEWKQFKLKVNDALRIFNVSQRIECFGGGVFSYFNFVSWLGKINFFTSLFYLGALVLPYVIIKPHTFNETRSIDPSASWNKALKCSNLYTSQLEAYNDNRSRIDRRIIDGLQGTGFMELLQFVFIGSYFDKIFWISKSDKEVRYDASFAFYFCLWITLGLSLIVTIIASGQRILKRMTTQQEKTRFTLKVLSRWDFIIQDRARAKVEKKNILAELKCSIDEEKRLLEKEKMSKKQKRILTLKRFSVWCSYFILLGGCLASIYFANDKSLQESETVRPSNDNTIDILQLFYQYLPSLVIVVANFLVATYCRKIVPYELYDANTEILLTIWRTVFLRFASLVVLMASIFTLLDECYRSRSKHQDSCYKGSSKCSKAPCWETYVGQQFYKLFVLDLFVFVLVILFDLFKKLVENKITIFGKPEFDIANNVLDLIYSQTLCWLGMFFCPLLPIVTFFKIILIYVVRKVLVVHHIYEHDAKSANAAQTDSYFLDILLFSLILVIILPLAVGTSLFTPSASCGPYRVYNDTIHFSIQSRAVINLPQTAENVYNIIDSLVVMIPLWILLALLAYFYYTLSRAREKLKTVLMERMKNEMKDLAFCRNQVKSALRSLRLAERAQM